MSEKKTEIILKALAILQEQGYPALTMRNLAKACDIKLASLQYHFKNWQTLIDAIAEHLIATYLAIWEERSQAAEEVDVGLFVEVALGDWNGPDDNALWPQLWAMGQQEPAVKEALDRIYDYYLTFLEEHFFRGRCEQPREEAIMLMSMLEGMYLFIGHEKVYASHREAIKQMLTEQLRARLS